ncbi:hypothetical protein WR25_24723 isoform B [Diploscapter pachys]|uniref:Deoxyhypusine hydroxylase n=1 Tax=Diploscapter pachys TaxID=2018661 RepID=A0A2A2L933_9BILA|nr:hypothetical protein WR25_24723 isoform B [Diploscapter pachys]
MGRMFVNGEQMTDINYVFKHNDRVEHWMHRHEHPVLDLPIRIINEDENLLVVDKPPSMPVHACGQYNTNTIMGQLRQNKMADKDLRVLHRLDRTTSGILLFAKNYATDLEFKTTLKDGHWRKTYVCKVEGEFPEGAVFCDQPIGNLVISMGIQCVRPDGKPARSKFRRMWTNGKESVVEVTIDTGRTHQIRVHAQFLGYPLIDDKIYNSRNWGEQKGKNAEYGKSYEELAEIIRVNHRSENWMEYKNPEYDQMMEDIAAKLDEITPDDPNIRPEDRPSTDKICLNCNVRKKVPQMADFRMPLHCLRYETDKWSFQTELPDWARESGGQVPESVPNQPILETDHADQVPESSLQNSELEKFQNSSNQNVQLKIGFKFQKIMEAKFSKDDIGKFGRVLCDTRYPLKARFRALFILRNIGDDLSVDWISNAFDDESALLKHELAYCLGQMKNKSAIPILETILRDKNQEPMVRHEAGEALGAIGDPSSREILKEYKNDPQPEVAETCDLALKRIDWIIESGKDTDSPYQSVDPTPTSSSDSIEILGKTLIDLKRPLWERYQAMFKLRNINTDESIKALAQGLYCEDSALFRHEIAYVLGQVQSPVATKELKDRLLLEEENCMVRHECAEALGAIATDECTEILKTYAKDKERVVRESCEVALDMAEYENSDELQQAAFVAKRRFQTSSRALKENYPKLTSFTDSDIGKMYEIDIETARQLQYDKQLTLKLKAQVETLNEMVTVVRKPLVEIADCMQSVCSVDIPALRLVLWGHFGTGKSVTLSQAVHLAYSHNWCIVYHPTAMHLCRRLQEVEMSTHKPGRINDPNGAVAILQAFKHQNQHLWKVLSELPCERTYEWSKVDKTQQGKPITEIVEVGLSAPFLASDCVGALFRELKRHASSGKIKLFVGIDDANSCWGKVNVRRADRTYALPSDLTLVCHYRNIMKNDWSNGIIVAVTDRKEQADNRNELEVLPYTPLETLGEEGFDHLDPFLPIECVEYSETEVTAVYNYYKDRRWISHSKALTDSGKLEMMHLSGFNPFYFERLCAGGSKMLPIMGDTTPPAPPARNVSTFPAKVTFKGAQTWRESLGMFMILLLGMSAFISVIILCVYTWKDKQVYEELVNYMDTTISISKIQYNPQYGIYNLNDRELDVLGRERSYKNLLRGYLFAEFGFWGLLIAVAFVYMTTDLTVQAKKIVFWVNISNSIIQLTHYFII